jgi:CBS domain containing-hemolysin-like protein
MIQFIVIVLLAALTLASVSLQKTYARIPQKELKRRARAGDELAKALFSAVSYGVSLQLLLWIVIGISAGAFFVVLSISLPSWLALFGCVALLWIAFAWLPNTRVSKASENIAQKVSPLLAKVLSKLYPLLNKIGKEIQKLSRVTVHSGIFQKEDLVDLIDRQASQPDNRMTAYEIGIVKSSLTFSDRIIRDIMTPKRVVKTVSQSDSIGPILMTELHKSGFSRFPVVGDKDDQIVGTLYMRDLVNAKDGGSVKDAMKKDVYYVNEEKKLDHALQAFLRTKHHLFIVVNGFEEIVGILTIEDVLEQVLGKQIVDEFDRYDDLRAVAALQAKKDAKSHKHIEEHNEKLEEPKELPNEKPKKEKE